MFGAIASLSNLIYPPQCLGCRAAGSLLCGRCSCLWSGRPIYSQLSGVRMLTTTKYSGQVAPIVLAAKEQGSLAARQILADSIARSIQALLTESASNPCQAVLVNIPSRASARRRRGENHSWALLGEVQKSLLRVDRTCPWEISLASPFRLLRRVQDQSGLDQEKRHQNLHMALTVPAEHFPILFSNNVVIVDDVVTSGSTCREAIRALRERGIAPLGVVAACASPLYFPVR